MSFKLIKKIYTMLKHEFSNIQIKNSCFAFDKYVIRLNTNLFASQRK